MKTNRNQAKKAFLAGFWQGMAASCYVFIPPPQIKRGPPSSDISAMRSDWRRIGSDFDAVIKKARKATNATA